MPFLNSPEGGEKVMMGSHAWFSMEINGNFRGHRSLVVFPPKSAHTNGADFKFRWQVSDFF